LQNGKFAACERAVAPHDAHGTRARLRSIDFQSLRGSRLLNWGMGPQE
jgi:hypothetical protein